jgi:hypothetical protein
VPILNLYFLQLDLQMSFEGLNLQAPSAVVALAQVERNGGTTSQIAGLLSFNLALHLQSQQEPLLARTPSTYYSSIRRLTAQNHVVLAPFFQMELPDLAAGRPRSQLNFAITRDGIYACKRVLSLVLICNPHHHLGIYKKLLQTNMCLQL